MDFDSVLDFLSFDRDFCYGILIFGCFRKLMNLLCILSLFYFSLKVLRFSILSFSCRFLTQCVNGLCLRNFFDGYSKMSIYQCGSVNFLNISSQRVIMKSGIFKDTVNSSCDVKGNGEDDIEHFEEDEVFDVMPLRRLVKMERQRANNAYLELEREQMASSTAAEEAMAMILRLQKEKSVVEMEAHQHQRLTHEKQLHDQEVIGSLRWIVMKYESERSILNGSLRFYKKD